jgi:hypothetical protein
MKLKDFFKLNWPIFIVFLVFNVLAGLGWFLFPGMFGRSAGGAGLFNIFSFFSQLDCSRQAVDVCLMLWDPFLKFAVIVLNLIWQFFLANLVVMIYKRIRK